MRAILGGLLLLPALCGSAEAAMFGELRGGVFAHDVAGDGGLFSSTRIEDANVEFLFKPLFDTYIFGSLNPHLGATANFGGRQSYGYAGLTWHAPIPLTPVFVETGLGAALGTDVVQGGIGNVGCAVFGHAEGSVGMSFIGLADVMLTAEHYFPLTGCGTAKAVTNVGARVGVSF